MRITQTDRAAKARPSAQARHSTLKSEWLAKGVASRRSTSSGTSYSGSSGSGFSHFERIRRFASTCARTAPGSGGRCGGRPHGNHRGRLTARDEPVTLEDVDALGGLRQALVLVQALAKELHQIVHGPSKEAWAG